MVIRTTGTVRAQTNIVVFHNCTSVHFSDWADDYSERAVTLVKVLVTMRKTINQGFIREHVRLYPKFVRQWGVFGCQRSSRSVLLVMNSRRMGW